jgi:parallel beta-helix repeat protein
MLTFRKTIIAVLSGVFTAAGIFAGQMISAGNGSPNTLSFYDPGLVKTINAYGPLVSQYIPRSNAESAAAADFVEKIQVPDGSEVRVLVKVPAPAQRSKILKVPPRASGQTPNEYFAGAIGEAISGGYAAVIFPKDVYDFAVPATAGETHLTIKGAKDLVIDGQGSTLNFASPLSAGVTISNCQRVVFKGFNIDWPHTLMASIGTIVSIDKKSNPRTMRVQIEAQYPVDATTQIIALSPWDAKTDPRNPHLALKNYDKEEYVTNRGTTYVGNHTFQVPYWNNYIEAGDLVMVRHFGWSPWKNAIQTGGSNDLAFENVNVYASPYLGFLLSGGGGYRLSHCSVTRLNAARLISSSADAVHVADNTGDIVIEDSAFGYQGDDGLNIHGAVGGTAQAGQNFLHWTVGGEGSYAPYGWTVNDPIGFFDSTFGFWGITSFQSLSHPKSGLQINLKDAAPKGATQIGDLSRVSARFVIRNNTFSYNRARGILLQSSFGIVENNTFTGQTAQGIVVGAASGSEGPGVQNVIFRGNHFSNVGSFPTTPLPSNAHPGNGALFVAIQDAAGDIKSTKPVLENLIFDANTFSDLQGPGLFLSTANNIVLVNNQFINTNLSRLQNANIATANLDGSVVVTQAHNVYIGKNSTRGTTTGRVEIDTTSTDGIRQRQ